ncbi:hypothetical protein KL918_001777 [Ogataea parapolymorpha]|nr:hypothetical protein KL918_001777 [Ogataea parapolymorpha]KAG7874261.1 hypothetical protein KL916_001601 [Ogataea parapolymorpha]
MSVGPSGRKIILDENGKPCRSCNTLLDFKAVTKSATKTVADDCPPDVEQLGRSTWTFLHSVAAKYPEQASEEQQEDMRTFLRVFGNIYPCWFCAKDFRQYMEKDKPKIEASILRKSDPTACWVLILFSSGTFERESVNLCLDSADGGGGGGAFFVAGTAGADTFGGAGAAVGATDGVYVGEGGAGAGGAGAGGGGAEGALVAGSEGAGAGGGGGVGKAADGGRVEGAAEAGTGGCGGAGGAAGAAGGVGGADGMAGTDDFGMPGTGGAGGAAAGVGGAGGTAVFLAGSLGAAGALTAGTGGAAMEGTAEACCCGGFSIFTSSSLTTCESSLLALISARNGRASGEGPELAAGAGSFEGPEEVFCGRVAGADGIGGGGGTADDDGGGGADVDGKGGVGTDEEGRGGGAGADEEGMGGGGGAADEGTGGGAPGTGGAEDVGAAGAAGTEGAVPGTGGALQLLESRFGRAEGTAGIAGAADAFAVSPLCLSFGSPPAKISPNCGTPAGTAGAEGTAGALGVLIAGEDELDSTRPPTMGFERSLVTAFFRVLPLRMSPSSASLSGVTLGSLAGACEGGPPIGGAGGGGGGGGADMEY